MKNSQLPLRHTLIVVFTLALLIGCQSTGSPDTPPVGAITARAKVGYSDSLRLPDSGIWRTNNKSRSDSGSGDITCTPNQKDKFDCSQSIALKAPLGSDLLRQDAYALGVQFATLTFSQTNSQTELTYIPDSLILFSMEDWLIRNFNAAYKQSPTSSKKPRAADLVTYYAGLLLIADSNVAGKSLPRGMSSDSVKLALVLEASRILLPAKALASKFLLGLTEETIPSYMRILVKAGLIKDTTLLYPLDPVRLVDSVRITGDIVLGQEPVAVTGSFAWDKKWPVRNPDAKVYSAQGLDSNIIVNFTKLPDLTSGSWTLAGALTVHAKKGARIGIDTLVIRLWSDSGSITSRTVFRVVQGDTLTPSFRVVDSVSVGTDLVAGEGSASVRGAFSWNAQWPVRIRIEIRNAQGLEDSNINVQIRTLPVPTSDSWTLSGNVSILAQQGARIGLDTLVVTLTGKSDSITSRTTFRVSPRDTVPPVTPAIDSVGPTIVWVAPKVSTAVEAATTSFEVQVKVTDPSGVDTVFIQGALAKRGADNVYSHGLDLPKPDGNPILVTVRATDAKGNVSLDSSVRIARKPPDSTDKPRIRLLKPTTATGNTLPFDSNTLHVEVEITDALLAIDVASVKFNSATPKATVSVYTADVPVSVAGKTFAITIKASNSNGTTSTLDIEVLRAADTAKPVILREAGATDREVPYASDTAHMAWKVTDNHRLAEVKINGALLTGSSDLFAFMATALKVGKNSFKLEAKDSSGNLVTDSVTITRAWKDTLAPTITRSAGTGPRSVLYEDSVYTPSWKVIDTLLNEVTIQSVAVTSATGIFSSPIALPLGRTLITLTAKDLAGHVSTDTFSVVRDLGTIPDLTISHPAGTNDSVLHVSIKSSIVDAVIKYTVDGSDPTSSTTALTYSTPVLIDQTRTLKAVATAMNHTPSNIASRLYTLVLPALIPDLPAGTSADTIFTVQLSCKISGATIHVSYDGTTPTSNHPGFTPNQAGGPVPFEIDSIRTLKAIAIKPGWSNSPVITLPYKANIPIKVYSSSEATAVIRADGSLWTTGRGVALMDGSLGNRTEFAKVMDSVKDVTESHILKLNGDLYAYGNNDSGLFGNGSKTSSNTPIFIRSNVKKVSDGRYFSLIIDQSNTMHAAGSNSLGAFCNGAFVNNATYSPIRTEIRDMAAGFSSTVFGDHMWTLFVTTAGDAYSCGTGPLGNGTSNQSQISNAQLVGTGFSAAYTTEGAAQHGGSFLVKTNGEAYSTHNNATQYLIPLTQPSAADTTFVSIRSGVKMIAGSYGNFFVLQLNGDLWGSGNNSNGSIGDGTQSLVNQPKLILSEAIFVAASRFNSFFIKANGALWAVGDNNGFFGNGTTESKLSPVRIKLP